MDAIISTVFWVIVIALVLFLVFSCANIVPQQHAYVIERLGKYRTTWNAGLHFKIPVIDRIARKALLKENESREPSEILLPQGLSESEILCEIRRFRETHGNVDIILSDGQKNDF